MKTIYQFFKKIIGKHKDSEPKKELEKVAFDEIGDLVRNRRKEIKDREDELFVSIKNKVSIAVDEFNETVKVLENVDLESEKVEDKIKLIVSGNLKSYIKQLKNLIENLDTLEYENLEKFFAVINQMFSNFDKRTHLSYQKITFLIGKEMADFKKCMLDFSKYLTKVFDENKDIIASSKSISFIELKLKQIEDVEESMKGVDERKSSLNREIKNIKKTYKEIMEEIEEIKKSEVHIKNLKKNEEIKSAEKELERDIYKLNQLVDLKALANVFHGSEKKWNLIKAHKEDFYASFKEDNGAGILSLLDEAELNNETILTKIKQINDIKDRITELKETTGKDESKNLLSKTEEMNSEIENLNNENSKELKRCQSLKTKREEIINSIKQELAKINVSVY